MESKYYKTWEQYKEQHPELENNDVNEAASKIQKYEEMMFNFIIGGLLL
ncbi:MAG: hypothetical protein ACOWWH_12145 [Eubacteriaceae bacterium]